MAAMSWDGGLVQLRLADPLHVRLKRVSQHGCCVFPFRPLFMGVHGVVSAAQALGDKGEKPPECKQQ